MKEISRIIYSVFGGMIGAAITGYFVVSFVEQRLQDTIDELRDASFYAAETDISHFSTAIAVAVAVAEAQLEALNSGNNEQLVRNMCILLYSEALLLPVKGSDSTRAVYEELRNKKDKLIADFQSSLGGKCFRHGGPV